MRTLLLAALLALAGPARAEEGRLPGFEPDAAALAGVYGAGYPFSAGGRSGEPFGHLEAGLRQRWGGFALDLTLLGLEPFSTRGTPWALGGAARAGVALEHVRALGGLALNYAPGATVQVLPSLTVEAGAGDWRGILGIFDRGGLVPARLGVGWRQFSLAYVPALGVEAEASWPVGPVDLAGRAFAYKLASAEALDLVVGVRFPLGGGR